MESSEHLFVALGDGGIRYIFDQQVDNTASHMRTISGSRVRVEHATGKIRPKPWLRGGGRGGGGGGGGGGGRGPPRGRRPFHSDDKCYECGGRGHYAYDCPRNAGGRRGAGPSRRSRSRSRSRSPKRSRRSNSHSRSRSPVKYRRSRSRSPSPARKRSPVRSRRSRSPRSRSHSQSPGRKSRSMSPAQGKSSPENVE